jgi:hypothetical protein
MFCTTVLYESLYFVCINLAMTFLEVIILVGSFQSFRSKAFVTGIGSSYSNKQRGITQR